MCASIHREQQLILVLSLCLSLTLPAIAQVQPPATQPEDVLRIKTELVQTAVIVSDKAGRFVEGLTPDQFELSVEGRPVSVSFFDRLKAGTAQEENRLAAATGKTPPPSNSSGSRTIVFFVDDRHLTQDNLEKTRKALTEFVENEMRQTDKVAIVSASGQIGFLQQLSDHKSVLRSAISRIKPLRNAMPDAENPPMTEYIAFRIMQGDRDALTYYTNDMLRSMQFTYALPKYGGKGPGFMAGSESDQVQRMVMTRAQTITTRSVATSAATLRSLEGFLRRSSQSTSRKYVFFISDGFFMTTDEAEQQTRRISDAATRSGSVIYTIKGQEIAGTSLGQVTKTDALGRLDKFSAGESVASQLPLAMLANSTGGRVMPAAPFSSSVSQATKDDADYYLLVWRPSSEEQKGENFRRIQVNVRNRPDLVVRMPRGFLVLDPNETTSNTDAARPTERDKARPQVGGLQTDLSVGFLDVPTTGGVVSISLQVATDALVYSSDGKQNAFIEVGGVVLDDQGKQTGGFRNRLEVTKLTQGAEVKPSVIYNHKIPLSPGIYQVRVAARDEKTGRQGQATSWIEIPNLSSRGLTISSLFLAEQLSPSAKPQAEVSAAEQMQFDVDHRFSRGSRLKFLSMIYNASKGVKSNGDLEAQLQIQQEGRTIISSPILKVPMEPGTDAARIPYGAEVALGNLPAGRYVLLVSIKDRLANSIATQHAVFDIE